jgi:hypothetical protein
MQKLIESKCGKRTRTNIVLTNPGVLEAQRLARRMVQENIETLIAGVAPFPDDETREVFENLARELQ